MGDPKIFECAWCVQHGAVQGWLHLRPEQVRKALQACQGPEVRRSEDDLREHPQVRSHGLVSEGGQLCEQSASARRATLATDSSARTTRRETGRPILLERSR